MLPTHDILAISAQRRCEFEDRAARARLVRLVRAQRPSFAAMACCHARNTIGGVRRAILVALHRPAGSGPAPCRCNPAV